MAGLGRRTHYRKHLTDSVLFDLPEPRTNQNEQIAKVLSTRGSNQFDLLLSKPITTIAPTPTTTTYSGSDQQEQQQESLSVLAILPTKFRKLIWLKRNDYVIVQAAMDTNSNGAVNKGTPNIQQNGNEPTITTTQEEDLSRPTISDSNDDIDKHKNLTTTKSITNTNNNSSSSSGGIRFMIIHILYKEQIKHLIAKGLWPMDHSEFNTVFQSSTMSDETTDDQVDDNQQQKNDVEQDVGKHSGEQNDNDDYEDEDENDDDNNDPLLFVNTNRTKRNAKMQDSGDEDDDSSN